MVFGLSFGGSAEKTNSKSTTDKTETTNQQSNQNTFGQTNTSQTGTSKTNSSGTSTTSQSGSTTADSTKSTTGSGTTTNLAQSVQDQLTAQLSALLGQGTNPATAGLSFDGAKYVADTTTAAQASATSGLDAAKAAIGDMIGSKLDNSSMATLLANRASSDSAASVAGVTAQAQQTAAQIANANAQTNLAGQAQNTNLEAAILAALKGASSTTTQTGTEGTTGSTTNQSTGTTNTSESSSTDTTSTAVQTVAQLVQALLTGTDVTHATGSTSGSTIKANAGLTL